MTRPRLVLASQSPRRHELLLLIGLPHVVKPAHLHEERRPGESPRDYVERLAREKAAAIASQESDAVVIGADTTVVLEGELLEKPVDEADAARMLKRLSGRTHTVLTAVAVVRAGDVHSAVERVDVTFRTLDDEQIATYIATGEPMDKAGAYALQGRGAAFVKAVRGSVTNVIGLPLHELRQLLRAL